MCSRVRPSKVEPKGRRPVQTVLGRLALQRHFASPAGRTWGVPRANSLCPCAPLVDGTLKASLRVAPKAYRRAKVLRPRRRQQETPGRGSRSVAVVLRWNKIAFRGTGTCSRLVWAAPVVVLIVISVEALRHPTEMTIMTATKIGPGASTRLLAAKSA